MDGNVSFAQALPYQMTERRQKPRVKCSYPALLRVHPKRGGRHEARAVLANFSASGMYFYTRQPVELGEKVFVSVRLSTAPIAGEAPPRLAVYGKVVRIEPKVDGTYGVAIRLNRHRFL
jgi:hypothetical protein